MAEWGGLEEVLVTWKGIQDSGEFIKRTEQEHAAGKLVYHKTKDNGEYGTWEDYIHSDGNHVTQARKREKLINGMAALIGGDTAEVPCCPFCVKCIYSR